MHTVPPFHFLHAFLEDSEGPAVSGAVLMFHDAVLMAAALCLQD